ncbi:MAG TPA: ABC transporter permease [Terriglobales bacterium]|nr:ABC transporter permease [Terriglobales bacterium]
MNSLRQDLQGAVRQFVKTPGLTAVVIITIALGIGANTALFSVVNGVLLNPLPYPEPEQLVTLHESKPNFDTGSISFPNFRDWHNDNHTFSSMAISRGYAFSLTGAGEATQEDGEFVTSDYFKVLGTKPLLGRTFARGEDEIGAAPVAVISEGLWRRKFASAPDIVGKIMTLNGRGFTIIGVIPANFHFALGNFGRHRDIYAPVGQWNNNLLNTRSAGLGFHGVGRLKPGVTIEQASADMSQVTNDLAAAFPDANTGISARLIPLKRWVTGQVRPLLLVLLASVGFVLLIACVNVANLLLSRSAGRAREFAIRAALGASQGRVVRQLLTESIVLGLVGGACGLLLAAWGTRAALGVLPTALPRAEEIDLDAHVLVFTLAISVLAGILFGLAPTIRLLPASLNDSLKEGARGVSGSRHRLQNAFVITEMALALVLLVGASLMIRTLTRLWSVDPGFDSHNVMSVGLWLPPSMVGSSPDAIRAAFRDFDQKISAMPGVKAVSQTWGAFPMGGDDERTFWIDGQPKPANENDKNWAIDYIVEPGYLRAMGTPLLRGRFFTEQDNEHAPHVVVVDDVFAKKFFPNQDPIGQRIVQDDSSASAEIVGVVGHVKQWGLDLDDSQKLRAQFYIPCMQMPDDFIAMTPAGADVIIRSEQAQSGLIDSVRAVSRQISGELVIFGAQSMDEIISSSLARRRFSMILLVAFAVFALLLACVGIYGVLSYFVGQRVHEIGIRMALGARRLDILRMILSGAGRLALIGTVAGLVAAFGLTRLMGNLLYGVGPWDPLTFIAVPAILIAVALVASYLPARRATRVDPMTSLRYE